MIVRHFRLRCSEFTVDVRLSHHDWKWIASVDTAVGPTLGFGNRPVAAVVAALEPFDGYIDELLQTLPQELVWRMA